MHTREVVILFGFAVATAGALVSSGFVFVGGLVIAFAGGFMKPAQGE